MEAGVALEFCIDHYDNIELSIYVKQIVSDDDSIMHAHIHHTEGGSKLPDCIHTPIFLVDPSHHIKVTTGIFLN